MMKANISTIDTLPQGTSSLIPGTLYRNIYDGEIGIAVDLSGVTADINCVIVSLYNVNDNDKGVLGEVVNAPMRSWVKLPDGFILHLSNGEPVPNEGESFE